MTDRVVSLSGVRVRYGPHTAIDEIDLTVVAGERVALVGPSGAGKTTVLRLCNATVVPSEGTVSVLGCDFATASERQRRAVRRRVGTVYQQLHLVGPLRVVHNVNAGRLASWGRARAVRSLVRPLEVDAARDALTRVGIGDKLYARTEHLSGGEQQRVALARLLRQEPDLILADEPVSSLDPARAEEVMDLLCGVVAQGTRALVVSLHDLGLAQRRCDRIVGLREGRVMFDLPASHVDGDRASALYRIVD